MNGLHNFIRLPNGVMVTAKEVMDLIKDNGRLRSELKEVKIRLLELEYRPPSLGGPGYDNARVEFESVRSKET